MHIWYYRDRPRYFTPEGATITPRCRLCRKRVDPLYLVYDANTVSDIQDHYTVYCGSCLRCAVLSEFTVDDIKCALLGEITNSTSYLQQILVAMLKQAIRTPEIFPGG